MSPRINRGARAAQAGPGLPHAPPGGAHLRPARLSPPSLHHSARCAHCSHRRLSNTKRRGGRGGGAADATRGEPGGGIQGCRMQWKPRPRRPRPAARATRRCAGALPDSRSPIFVDGPVRAIPVLTKTTIRGGSVDGRKTLSGKKCPVKRNTFGEKEPINSPLPGGRCGW